MHEMADQMQLLDLNLSPVGSKKPWKGRTTREDAHGASHSENRNGFAKANEFLPQLQQAKVTNQLPQVPSRQQTYNVH